MMDNGTTYMNWLKHLPSSDGELKRSPCPKCRSVGLAYQYFGFDDNEFGWKLVWCKSCNSGINISRTKIPDEASRLIDESEQDKFLERHSHIQLID